MKKSAVSLPELELHLPGIRSLSTYLPNGWLPLLPVWLAPFALLGPMLLAGKTIFWGTVSLQFVPWQAFAWETLQSGHLPLWNPLVGMGAPLAANYQSALFYPPNWLLYPLALLGGVPWIAWGQGLLVALHMAWAGTGLALLARRLGLSPVGQAVGGLAFGLSGYLVARSGFLSINAAVAWAPWILLLGFEFVSRNKWGGNQHFIVSKTGEITGSERRYGPKWMIIRGSLMAIVIAMQLLAGHAQTTWYTLLLLFAWCGYWGWRMRPGESQLLPHASSDISYSQDIRTGAVGGKNAAAAPACCDLAGLLHTRVGLAKKYARLTGLHNTRAMLAKEFGGLKGLIRAWVGLAAVITLAAALAAVQLLPTAEYLSQSHRASAIEYEFALTYSFWPARFLTLFAPDFFGNPAHGDYQGYGNFWEDHLYLGLLPLFLAVGVMFSRLRDIRKRRHLDDREESWRGPVGFLTILVIVSFLLALGKNTPVYPWLYRHIPTFDMFQAPARFALWAELSLAILAAYGMDRWRRPEGRALYWTRLGTVGAAAVAIGAGLASILFPGISPAFLRAMWLASLWGTTAGALSLMAPTKSEVGGFHRWGLAVLLLVAADLLVAGWGLNPGIEMDYYRSTSPEVQQLGAMAENGRIYLPSQDEYSLKFDRFMRFETFQPGEDWSNLPSALLPNLNMLEGIASVNNFDPLVPGRFVRWMDHLGSLASEEQKEYFMNFMNVRVVERIDPDAANGVRFAPVESGPRARWVPCSLTTEDGEAAWNEIAEGEIDPEKEVVLEGTSRVEQACTVGGEGIVEILSEEPGSISLRTSTDRPGWLVLSDTWYPGWQARVDGRVETVLRANYLFRAIYLEAGDHEVIFQYWPLSFWLGLSISLIACLVLSVWWWIGRQPHEEPIA